MPFFAFRPTDQDQDPAPEVQDQVQEVTASELAFFAVRSVRTVQRDCASGRIPGARKVGRDWIIPGEAATAYAETEPYDSLRKRKERRA